MKELRILKLIFVVNLVLISLCENVNTITVDNQLVSVQSDCFERIAFGAMLPLEKSFRMEDMNLLPRCQELCLKEGEKCQTLAFGIHASRNGTCQLSSEKISATNSQPVGTIFDPDFDLYSRKTNCFDFVSSNEILPGNTGPSVTTLNDQPSTSNNVRPPPPPYGPVTTSNSYPSSSSTISDDRYTRPNDRYTSTTPNNKKYLPNRGYDNNDIPADRNYPTRRPSTIYQTETYPSGTGSGSSSGSGGGYGHTTSGDKIYFSHDGPLYTNQMLYDTSYPMSNNPYPGVYAGNVATVGDRYRPPSSDIYGEQPKPSVRPIYGSGYGNGYSYGTPEPNRFTNSRPTYDRPSTNYGNGITRPGTIYRPSSSRPDNDRYSTNRPEYDPPNRPYDSGSNIRPIDNGYDSRPDNTRPQPPQGNGYGTYTQDSTTRPTTQGYYNQRPQDTNGQNRPQDSSGYGGAAVTRPQNTGTIYNPSNSQGNGYDNTQSRPQTLPGSGYIGGTTKPTDVKKPQDQSGYGVTERPQDQTGYGGAVTRRPQNQPGYGDVTRRPQDQPGYGGVTRRPQDQPGYGDENEPYRPQDKPNRRPYDPHRPDTSDNYDPRPEGNYNRNNTYPSIETYFNPDEYIETKWTIKPGNYPSRGYGGLSGSKGYDERYPIEACFRRVLAGKRISPQWIRRTIACERVEDCMRECGREKRFQCEGFNYRLDPSGHGQGDCELIELPLEEMDLYSTPQLRDLNLLRHPDYDYYERDRNAPSSCRQNCNNCGLPKPISSPPLYFRPGGYDKPYGHNEDQYPIGPSGGGGGGGYGSGQERYRPGSTAIDKYRPSGVYVSRPVDEYHRYDFSSHSQYDDSGSSGGGCGGRGGCGGSGGGGGGYYRPSSSGSGYGGGDRVDRYDVIRPEDSVRPDIDRWQTIPSSHGGSSYGGSSHGISSHGGSSYGGSSHGGSSHGGSSHGGSSHGGSSYNGASYGGSSYGGDYYPRPPTPLENVRPDNDRPDRFRPPFRPGSDYSPYRPQYEPQQGYQGSEHDNYRPSNSYLDRDRSIYDKNPKYIPYLIGVERDWGSYGGSYGGEHSKNADYWGIRNDNRRKDNQDFNYFDLGVNRRPQPYLPIDNSIHAGSRYGGEDPHHQRPPPNDRHDYGSQWTRRPGPDECSVKSSEGFRLHKAAIRHAYKVPTVTECEKLCSSENKFICHTYSYRYSTVGRENCLLCDRPVNLLDYYIDIEPDRNYDIYSMADEHNSCGKTIGGSGGGGGGGGIGGGGGSGGSGGGGIGGGGSGGTAISDPRNNAQCFFRAIDTTRFFKSIVRDSLTVRSVGECELECIKSSKFSCRAFAYRYGQRSQGGIIDNCQLSDWPVRDMDKERHLISDPSFDVFERASYGHGCEIQPIVDDKHKKLCYLGYGSAAKLLAPAIKKVISVGSEIECKKECIRFRETTPFKCYSFSYGSQASTYNCEMSDLDQSQLKVNVHYSHATNRDYWLFAWNPFDWTCRDKVTTIGGSRVNNDRRMDIFREPGDVTWRHYTVSGKPCRIGSDCAKNLVTGFYSCEIDGAEIGSWDYCCKADYPCGYSQGFQYPWCFVGDEPDQWRKCSDRYYPGNNTNIKSHSGITHPPKNHNKNKPLDQNQQKPPQPGGLQSFNDFTAARLWPVTYLYSEGPPNSTELSNFVDCNKETC